MNLSTRKSLGTAALFTAVLVLTAGCAADSGDDPAEEMSAAAIQECITASEQIVEEARQEQVPVLPDDVLDMAALKGKSVWYIPILINQYSASVGDGIEEAAHVAGLEYQIYDGAGAVDQWNAGINQAVAQGAGAIILLGIEPSLIQEAVAKATAAGVTVINFNSSVPGTGSEDAVNVDIDTRANLEKAAAWVAADSGCDADVALFYSTTIPTWVDSKEGFEAALGELCPQCNVTIVDLDLANLANDAPQRTQTTLQRNPEIKYLVPVWDSAVTFIAPAATQINPDIKILGHDGLPENLADIRDGGTEVVTMAVPALDYIGWQLVDEAARGMLGMDHLAPVYEARLVDSENVGASDDDVYSGYQDFRDSFLTLWGNP